MGLLADRLDALDVRVDPPGARFTARLRGRTGVEVRFHPGAYRTYDERLLEQHLAAAATLLWVARTREFQAARSEVFGMTMTGESPPATTRDRDFDEERDHLVASGASPDGLITVTVRGMRSWQVRIVPGTVAMLDEAGFTARLAAAATELIEDQNTRIAKLKARFYDPRHTG